MSPFSASTVCFRRYPLAGALETARSMGFEDVDLVGLRGLCEHVPVNGSLAEHLSAARTFLASGLRAASVNADPGSFDGADDSSDVFRRIENLLAFCQEATVPMLVLPCGEKTTDAARAPEYERMADGLNRVAERGRAAGVRIVVEAPYHGRPVDRLDRVASLVDLLSDDILLALDASHIEAAAESIPDAWARWASRIGIVHLRDAVPGDIRRVIGRGRVDFGALFSAAAGTGYDGDWVLELETRDSPFASKEEEVADAVERLTPLLQEAYGS